MDIDMRELAGGLAQMRIEARIAALVFPRGVDLGGGVAEHRAEAVFDAHSFAVMASIMNLSGYVAVDHGIAQGDVFRIISAHIVGMFGLVIVVGDLIDRMGRQRAITAGLTLMAASILALVWFDQIVGMSVALFGLGLGWSFSYVAATAELVRFVFDHNHDQLSDPNVLAIGVQLELPPLHF